MKKKEILNDLELYVDPTPLTKDEEVGLSFFIRQLKEKMEETSKSIKQNSRSKADQI
ncbi:hypothetical protein [Aquirufa sp.]|jgi:hypothetical protein|uniref:hypothetical protein n=1 Tax=Aquirufa sp. TaxID=2676249 RepID=UPI003784F0C6